MAAFEGYNAFDITLQTGAPDVDFAITGADVATFHWSVPPFAESIGTCKLYTVNTGAPGFTVSEDVAVLVNDAENPNNIFTKSRSLMNDFMVNFKEGSSGMYTFEARFYDANGEYITSNQVTLKVHDSNSPAEWEETWDGTYPNLPTDPEEGETTTPETPDTPAGPTNPDEEALAITPAMLQLIVTQILGKVNERIAGRIVTSISDASDDNHVPSALAVFNFLRTLTPGMSCQTVVGSMDTITDPDSQIIYLQKDDEADPTWTMYLWVDGAWVAIGDTSIDLVNYWSKSDADIAELREKILGQEGLDAIKDSLDLTDVLRNDEASKEIVTGWMSEYLGTDMTNIVNNVMSEVEKVYVKKEDLPAAIAVITEAQITAAVNGAFAATEPQI